MLSVVYFYTLCEESFALFLKVASSNFNFKSNKHGEYPYLSFCGSQPGAGGPGRERET